jgi:hypothetical protein
LPGIRVPAGIVERMRALAFVLVIALGGCQPPHRRPKTVAAVGAGVAGVFGAAAFFCIIPFAVADNGVGPTYDLAVCGPLGIAAAVGVGLVLGGGLAYAIAKDRAKDPDELRPAQFPPPPFPLSPFLVLGQESDSQQRPRVASEIAANARAAAHDGHCDKVVELVAQLRTLDSAIHASLTTLVEIRRCLPSPTSDAPPPPSVP